MEDSKIIELYWQRETDAIAQTQRKYGPYCLAIAGNILPTREDAQECVNDTYLAAWNGIPPARPAFLSGFLGKLTRRISIDRWRSMNADKRGAGAVTVALEELGECIPGKSDPVREVEAKELAEAINRFLDLLPPTEREVFLMRYFHMADMKQIEQRFHMSSSKAKSMLYRVRIKLREYLKEEGFYGC